MPYFKWYGLTAEGQVKRGELFSRNAESVAWVLWNKHGISILDCKERLRIIAHSTAVAQQAALFQQLGTLLSAGVRVREALCITADMISHAHSRLIVQDCAQAVMDGMLLSEAMRVHSELFSPFSWSMMRAGEQSGNIAQACYDLAQYYRVIVDFRVILRTALLVPAMTIMLAMLLLIGIVYGVVPQFARIMMATKGKLPRRTELLFAVAAWMRTPFGICVLLGITIGIICGIVWIVRWGRKSAVAWLAHVPLVKVIIQDFLLARYFAALSCLLHGGTPLARALELATQDIAYEAVRYALMLVVHDVTEGVALSNAYIRQVPYMTPSVYALIRIGESTGALQKMTYICAQQYQKRVEYWLQIIGRFIQPVVLMVLGLMVGLLALALYEPILSLGTVMTQCN